MEAGSVSASDVVFAILGLLPIIFIVSVATLKLTLGADKLRAPIEAYLIWVLVCYLSAELLSFFGAIKVLPVLALWIVAVGSVLCWLCKHDCPRRLFRWVYWRGTLDAISRQKLAFVIVLFFLLITLFISLTSEPNNWDSQTYRLPRIEHWIQDGSLAHYPTVFERQNALGPLAEILLLHLRLISGSHAFYPLIQWISMLCSVIAVCRITQQLGGTETQSWIAAVFLSTLPMGILQSTSTQNDYVEGALLACFVSFGLDALERPGFQASVLFLAAIAGTLSGIVKPVGYLIGSGFALWFAVSITRQMTFSSSMKSLAMACVALALLLPFAARNLSAYGSIQSPISAVTNNASLGIKQTLDNLVLNAASNLSTGMHRIDSSLTRLVLELTSALGLDNHRSDTIFAETKFNLDTGGVLHEDFGPNPVHMILIVAAFSITVVRWWRSGVSLPTQYWGALLVGAVAFAAVLRWQPWGVRLQLPAFVLVAPAVATAWPRRWRDPKKASVLLFILVCGGLPALLFNATRRLLPIPGHAPSYLVQERIRRLFVNWPTFLDAYVEAVDVVSQSHASQIGLLFDTQYPWEYPIWSMLRERKSDRFRIEHLPSQSTKMTHWPLGHFRPEAIISSKTNPEMSLNIAGQRFLRVSGPFVSTLFTSIAAYTTAEFIPPMRIIDIAKSKLAGATFLKGWSGRESGRMAMTEQEAEIEIAARAGPLTLVIDTRSDGLSQSEQVVEVLVNDVRVGRMVSKSHEIGTASFYVARDLARTNGIIKIVFRMSNPFSQTGIVQNSSDKRSIGLALTKLSLEQRPDQVTQ